MIWPGHDSRLPILSALIYETPVLQLLLQSIVCTIEALTVAATYNRTLYMLRAAEISRLFCRKFTYELFTVIAENVIDEGKLGREKQKADSHS